MRLPTARFGRVLTAMVTPFDEDGRLDLDVARQLARYLQDHGQTSADWGTPAAEERLVYQRAGSPALAFAKRPAMSV